MSQAPLPAEAPDWGPWPSLTQPVRVALIGISGYGFIYLQMMRELAELGVVKIVAAVVINADQEAANVRDLRARGAAMFSDYEEMLRTLAGQIDLCLIPTGIPWHRRMTVAALQAGANVLVEKPLAGSQADAQAIIEAERAAQRFVAVGFQDFYTPGTRWLKQQLVSGAIGQLRSVRALGFWPRAEDYYRRNGWAGRLYTQGAAVFDSPFNNAFGHFVNLALYYCGTTLDEVASARDVEAELLRAHAIESFDTGVVRARTANGTALWLGFSHACRTIADPEIVIEGTGGTARWTYEKICTVTPTGGPASSHPLPDAMNTRRLMFMNVLRRLTDPAATICDTTMALRLTELIEAMYTAATVRTIPADMIDLISLPQIKTPVPSIRGIEESMQAACQKQQLLRELGFPLYAVPAK
jgi:predicted dehydrogenase